MSALVRQHLKHCAQFWALQYHRCGHNGWSQRAIKLIKELEYLSYKERLRELGELNLAKTRLWGILPMPEEIPEGRVH